MYACLFQPVPEASACGLASAASEPARDSREPLRSANALSNSAGGGAPAHIEKSGAPRVGIMCAEAVWWRCHRQLVADALVASGLEVRHIVSSAAPTEHTLTSFARISDGRVSYRGLI